MAGFRQVGLLLDNYKVDDTKQRRISREWQDYAYRMALELDDKEHTSLYMRMCKNTQRSVLEEALTFVRDSKAKSKAKLFMWKVKELKGKMKE